MKTVSRSGGHTDSAPWARWLSTWGGDDPTLRKSLVSPGNSMASCFCWASFIVPEKCLLQMDRLSLRHLIILPVFLGLCTGIIILSSLFGKPWEDPLYFLECLKADFQISQIPDFPSLAGWWQTSWILNAWHTGLGFELHVGSVGEGCCGQLPVCDRLERGGCPVPQTSHRWLHDLPMVLPTHFWTKNRAQVIPCKSQWFFHSISDSWVTVTTPGSAVACPVPWRAPSAKLGLQSSVLANLSDCTWALFCRWTSHRGGWEWAGEDIYPWMICTRHSQRKNVPSLSMEWIFYQNGSLILQYWD